MSPILELAGVDVRYGSTQVLFGVDLDVQEGEILALLGTNGAGKSTIFRAVCGLAEVSAGSVRLDGTDITNIRPGRSAGAGIAQVPGGRGVFPTLSVAENLRAASWALRKDRVRLRASVDEALDRFPVLRERADTPAGALSGGEQQMLSLAQAFVDRPRLLLIDELSLGLAPAIVDGLLQTVRDFRAEGTTIVLIEQSVSTALRVADRAVFLEKGEVRFTGAAADLLERGDLLRSVYLKGTAGITVRERDPHAGPRDERVVALGVADLRKHYGGVKATDHVSFDVRDGETVGLIGPNGAGKTTIMDLISGLQSLDGGSVHLYGADISTLPAHARALAGLGRTFQDARLFSGMTVHEVLCTALEQEHPSRELLPAAFRLGRSVTAERWIAERADELVELVGLGSFRDKFISELSTGSRRIAEIGALVAQRPTVLLLDEPSSGIAQKEAEALATVIQAVRDHLDASILIIEHSMPLLTSIADRLVALETGQVVTAGTVEEVLSHPQVVRAYLGERRDEPAALPSPRSRRRPTPMSAGGSR